MESDPVGTNILVQILVLVALTLVNAFFACAEMATVSVNKNKINMLAEGGNKNAALIQKLLEEPTKFLSTIQVAITLAGFFASGSAATGISAVLGAKLQELGVPYGSKISFVVITIVLSYFTLVFGELVPKRIALQKAEAISMFAIKPINFVSKAASPFIKLLTASTNLTLRVIGMNAKDLEAKVSEEEIRSMIEVGQEAGVFNRKEKEMITSIFEFDDKLAKEVMTPRINVYAIDILDPIESYLDEMLEMKYSRIPVYEEDIDNIIGILYIKDFLLEARKKGFENVDIRSILHKPYLVPESKNIDELFKELQQSHIYLAILIDEYGGFSGIVSIEDLVEEIMGDISDEYDDGDPTIQKLDHNTYIIDGLISIDELNNRLDLDISSDNYDTLSGLLVDIIGAIPNEDDNRTIEFDNMVFKLEKIKEKRIEKVKLYIPNKEPLKEELE